MTKIKTETNFAKALERLELIIKDLEKPNISLEDRLMLLEEGTALHKECKEKLNLANTKLKTLLEDD